ncbi:MAG: hypothetical protein QM737_15445 [Ferruginibacter sp.]
MKTERKKTDPAVTSQNTFFPEKGKADFFAGEDTRVQRSPVAPATGVPNNGEVWMPSDPGFQDELIAADSTTAAVQPALITLNVSMEQPADPYKVIYSDKPVKHGTWEEANFSRTIILPTYECIDTGKQSSYVKEITFGYTDPVFEFLISKEIEDNMNDQTKTTAERILWRRLDGRLRTHAGEHFTRYNNVITSFKKTLLSDLSKLPNRQSPVQIPKAQLDSYVSSLLTYYMQLFAYDLWDKTCGWEKEDYSKIIPDVNKGQAATLSISKLEVKCGAAPHVDQKPEMPVMAK